MIYQATIRDYTFGCDLEWEWTGIPQLGFGTYRTDRIAVPGQHGLRAQGGDWGGASVLSWPLEHTSGNKVTCEQAAARLRAAFAPHTTEGVLELSIEMQTGVYVLRGRPMAPEVVLDEGQFGAALALVQFEATDPLLYGALKSVSIAAPGSTGGMVTPMVTPMVLTGGGSTGNTAITNSGTAPAEWTAIVTGGTTGVQTPRLILGGETVEVAGFVPAGSVLSIDSRNRFVALDGQPRPWATFGSSWWKVPPGQSTFSFRAVSGDGMATLTWRDASY